MKYPFLLIEFRTWNVKNKRSSSIFSLDYIHKHLLSKMQRHWVNVIFNLPFDAQCSPTYFQNKILWLVHNQSFVSFQAGLNTTSLSNPMWNKWQRKNFFKKASEENSYFLKIWYQFRKHLKSFCCQISGLFVMYFSIKQDHISSNHNFKSSCFNIKINLEKKILI